MVALAVTVWFLFVRAEKSGAPGSQTSQTNNEQASESRPQFPFTDLQSVVDTWDASQSGTASVVIYDLDNDKTAASLNPDRVYFSASLYKLFVAYVGYQKVADGTYDLDDSYLSGYTRGKCLDEMIRSSSIPCGEKMALEIGSSAIMEKLRSFGFKFTNMSGAYATTSASDVTIILIKIANGEGLSEEHKNLYLDSMKTQPDLYRRGLPKGFESVTVYNKVGWNLTREWHDAAIIVLPDGHRYVVTVLTESVGMNNIAKLATAIEQKISQL